MQEANRSPFRFVLCFCLAAILFCFVKSPGYAENQQKVIGTTSSLASRQEAVFVMVDKLRALKKPTVKQLESLIKRPMYFSHGGQYETDLSPEEDIIDLEAPYDDDLNLNIHCILVGVNQSLKIKSDDVVRRYGKYSKTYISRGNRQMKAASERILYYKKKQLGFRFPLNQPKHLISVSIYFD